MQFKMDAILDGRIRLSNVRSSMQLALMELEDKAPHKVDLIESQKRGIDDLTLTMELIHRMEQDLKTMQRNLITAEQINLKQIIQLQMKDDQIETLLNG